MRERGTTENDRRYRVTDGRTDRERDTETERPRSPRSPTPSTERERGNNNNDGDKLLENERSIARVPPPHPLHPLTVVDFFLSL